MHDTDDHPIIDPTYREAFSFLDSETRVDILRVLTADIHESIPDEEPGLSFSSLRERVGIRDSGRFNYHLEQLTGTLIKREEETYQLTVQGFQAAATLLSGAFAAGEQRGPTTVDRTCPVCGGELIGEYDDGTMLLVCERDDDHAVGSLVPPGAAHGRTLKEIADMMRVISYHDIAQSVQNICPECRSSFEWRFQAMPDGKRRYVGICSRCPMVYTGTGGLVAATDPAVVSFFHDHGIDVRERGEMLTLLGHIAREIVSSDPPQVAITFEAGDQQLRAVLNDTAQVLETTRYDT